MLYQGDCLDIMPDIPDGSVDMILADPPYGTTACKWDSIIPLEPMWIQLKRIIKPNGTIAMTANQPFTSALVMSNTEMFRYCWIWEKEQGTNFLSAKKNPLRVHEDILIFYLDEAQVKGRSVLFKDLRSFFLTEKEKSGLTSRDFAHLLGNDMLGHYITDGVQWTLPTEDNYRKLQTTGFFKINYSTLKKEYDELSKLCRVTYKPQMTKGRPYISGLGNSGEVTGSVRKRRTLNAGTRYPRSIQQFKREMGLHPTQKPVALMEYLIKTYTNENETVLDFCMGSGTTGVACLNLNRDFIGIEKDSECFEIAQERIDNVMPLFNVAN